MIKNTTITVWVNPDSEFRFLQQLQVIASLPLKHPYKWEASNIEISKFIIPKYVQINIDLESYILLIHSFQINGGLWK